MRPERSEEVLRLDARTLEGAVQVGIPRVPELDRAQERLENGLLLVVTAGTAKREQRRAVLEDEARRQRVARTRMRPDLVGPRRVEEELLTAHAHADTGIAQDAAARDPAAARRGIEYVAVLVYNRDMCRVLADAGRVETERRLDVGERRGIVGRRLGDIRPPVRPRLHLAVIFHRI